jgi:hypothetical protein
MHEMTPEHAHEEIHLLALDFSSMVFETQVSIPAYREWFMTTDQTESYRYLRRVLQALQWLRGGDRWVLKSPQHIAQLGPLLRVFPDASVVLTHRDPAAVTVSVATMLAYLARLAVDRPDPEAIGRAWTARIEGMLLDCLRDRDEIPTGQALDVPFHDYMADEHGTIERIGSFADLRLDGDAGAAIAAYGATHRRGRHGGIIYEPDVLGIDIEGTRRALTPYIERFGVRLEPVG